MSASHQTQVRPMQRRRTGTLQAGPDRQGVVEYSGDDPKRQQQLTTYPVPIYPALHALCSRMGALEALGHGDGRGALVITGRVWRDESHMPDPDDPPIALPGPPGAVDMLSAAQARGAGVALFAKALAMEIDEKIGRFLREAAKEREGA